MLNKRVIPCLLIKDDKLVKTVSFENPKYIGDPINCCKLYSDLEVDEIIVLDISATRNNYINFNLLKNIASECFVPLTYGGGIKGIEDMKKLVSLGYEKFIINTACVESNFSIIEKAVEHFGAQSIIACCDIKKNEEQLKIFNYLKKDFYDISLENYVTTLSKLNIGEILFHFVELEGTFGGLDIESIQQINDISKNKNIFMGGTKNFDEIVEVLKAGIDTLGVGSLFVFSSKKRGVLINYLSENERQIIENFT